MRDENSGDAAAEMDLAMWEIRNKQISSATFLMTFHSEEQYFKGA